MRRFFIVILTVLVVLTFTAAPMFAADNPAPSCAKCCKDAKACCDDTTCCKTAADGSHSCSMKRADGSACTHACCKDKSCTKKTS